jgi:hypothetical protein
MKERIAQLQQQQQELAGQQAGASNSDDVGSIIVPESAQGIYSSRYDNQYSLF